MNRLLRTLSFTTLILSILLPGLASARELPAARPESVGMSAERLARIGPAMQRYIDSERVPGTITAVMRKGKLVHLQMLGNMDVDEPMRRDAIFRIASMTKPITSVALMMLWEEGLFQLRDPVSRFLPEFADVRVSTSSDASGNTGTLVALERPIQIRDLFTHTAGLANSYVGNTSFYQDYMGEFDHKGDLAAYIRHLATLPLNYQPGTKWEYSAATDVLGRLVEVLSGQPLDVFLKTRIFDPLEMTDTRFFLDAEDAPRLTAQYTPGAYERIELQDPGTAESRWISGPKSLFRGAGGLVSTVDDYLRFQQMMLRGGTGNGARLLSPATVSLMLENHTGELPLWLAGPGMGFGLGYAVVLDRGAAATPLSEGAAYWGGAYCTLSWFDPEQDLVAVVMTQVRPYTHLNIRQDFQSLVYQAIVE